MLIAGAKGFATEVLEVMHQAGKIEKIAFFEEISGSIPEKLFGKFTVLTTVDQCKEWFKSVSPDFTLGTGGPVVRRRLDKLLSSAGGKLTSAISPKADIGHFGNQIGDGCSIMTGAVVTSNVTIGRGVLINLNTTVGHECEIGDFCELSPGTHLSGRVILGNFCDIGTGAVLLPGIELGENVTVGAGAVVTKNVDANTVVTGIPAKTIRSIEPLCPITF